MIEKMDPIFDAETQQEFARMHQLCEEAGCIAFGFVAGGLAAIKVQAKRHQQASHADGIITEYFRTREEALDWMKTLGL
jgi:DNA transposition AAA+ family ATPase